MVNNLAVRNSTIDFLIFTKDSNESIQVKVFDENIWLTQKLIAKLFDVDRSVVTKHLKNIFEEQELNKSSVSAKFAHTAKDGKTYQTLYYNLDTIISVGYRVNSRRATDFRIWATKILKQFAIKGYVLDRKRLENGSFLNKNYFDELLAEIREIRLSERNFYQKITDIYSTSIDYDKEAKITRDFFAKVQNKLHYAIHGQTASELIANRVSSKKQNMGLTSWKNSPKGKLIKTDIFIAKNYLKKSELESLGRIVSAYLDLAEERAKRKIPMAMEDWSKRLDKFLEFDDREILNRSSIITKKEAKALVEKEFEKYRLIQDKLFQSDFDNLIKKTKKLEK